MKDFSRVIGAKKMPELGALRAPTAQERAWVKRMALAQTCVPKGVFKYRTPEEASADWDRWQVDAIKASINGGGEKRG